MTDGPRQRNGFWVGLAIALVLVIPVWMLLVWWMME
jgi:hypothetical protein